MKHELLAKDIINQLMKINNISEAALYKKTGLKQQTLNRLLAGATPDPRISTLEPIADYFNITMDQLLGKQPLETKNSQYIKHTKLLPILSWDKISQSKGIRNSINLNNWQSWAATIKNIGDDAFALRIENKSLPPPFYYHSIVIVDPDGQYSEGDTVLYDEPESNQVLIRRVFYDGDKMYLLPLKDNLPPKLFDVSAKIRGVIVEIQIRLQNEIPK